MMNSIMDPKREHPAPLPEQLLSPEANARILRATLLLYSFGLAALWVTVLLARNFNPLEKPGLLAATVIVGLTWVLYRRRSRAAWVMLTWGFCLGAVAASSLGQGLGRNSLIYFTVPSLIMLCAWVLSARQAIWFAATLSALLLQVSYWSANLPIVPEPWPPMVRAGVIVMIYLVGLLATLKILKEYRTNFDQRVWAMERMAQLNRDLEETVARRTQEAVEGRARLQAIIESTSDLIWSVEAREFRLVTFNQAFQDYLEQEMHQHLEVGQTQGDLLSKDLAETWRSLFQRALDEGPFGMEYQTSAGDRMLHLAFNQVRRGESVVGVSVFGRDITERKRNEALLMEARQTAEAATRAKSEFLANMSHEIRTPLNAVLGMTHLALQTDLSDRQRGYLEKAKGAGDGLLGVINDILDFSKIEAGKLQMDAKPFLLEEVFERVTQLVGQRASEKHLAFSLEKGPEVPSCLVGDPLRLGQVLTNLCGNAVKFTERGGITVVALRRSGPGADPVALEFCVRDSGIGMTQAQTRSLFQPFSQVDTSSTRKFTGTGLGLAISKRLVELMGGELWVDSVVGQGSEFCFTATFGIGTGAPRLAGQGPSADDLDTLRGAQVLLVEDNEFNQLVAGELLTQLGVEITVASDGAAALELIHARAFGAVLMDLQMPVMDGYEATRRLRADPRFANLPILAMTAHAMTQERDRCAALGMNDYITKPIDPQELFVTLAQWLRVRT